MIYGLIYLFPACTIWGQLLSALNSSRSCIFRMLPSTSPSPCFTYISLSWIISMDCCSLLKRYTFNTTCPSFCPSKSFLLLLQLNSLSNPTIPDESSPDKVTVSSVLASLLFLSLYRGSSLAAFGTAGHTLLPWLPGCILVVSHLVHWPFFSASHLLDL